MILNAFIIVLSSAEATFERGLPCPSHRKASQVRTEIELQRRLSPDLFSSAPSKRLAPHSGFVAILRSSDSSTASTFSTDWTTICASNIPCVQSPSRRFGHEQTA